MATQIMAILCEGPHDVAFIVKILKTIGFKSNEGTKLADFPFPMSDMLKNEVAKSNVEELKFTEIRQILIPANTLKKDDIYLFLYALGGDSRKDLRGKILKQFVVFLPNEGEIQTLPSGTILSIAYFFDADKNGIEDRIQQVNLEIAEVIENFSFNHNAETKAMNGLQLGCYIFSKEAENTGKLEDMILPLMKQGNEKIFDNAKVYLDDNYVKSRAKDFEIQKATIGVAGQLQKSGSTNTVIIAQSDFITEEKILADAKCKEIISFFESLIQ